MQKECFGIIDIKPFKDVAIVLDASESASECQETIVKTTIQLIEKLPRGSIKGLYFLSNSKQYDIDKLLRNSATWWEQNKLRGSFLTPVLEQIKESMAVVIGSGPIYDLEDWQDSFWNSNLYFYKVKDTLRGDWKIGQEFQELSQATSFLFDPILSIEITGTGFMPFYWNNPEYKLSFAAGVKLIGSNFYNPSVTLGYFGDDVKAEILRKSGEETIALKSVDYQEQDTWNTLTERESEIFHRASRGEEFTCIICGHKHPASRIRCDTNSILGEPIYPSLGKKRGFILFKENTNKVCFKFHPVSVIQIHDHSVAISLDGKEAQIYELDPTENQWQEKMDFNHYHASGDSRILFI